MTRGLLFNALYDKQLCRGGGGLGVAPLVLSHLCYHSRRSLPRVPLVLADGGTGTKRCWR